MLTSNNSILIVGLLSVMLFDLNRPVCAQEVAEAPDALSAQVDAMMDRARVNDFNPSRLLLRHKDQVLPLLEKYVNDPSPSVTSIIYEFVLNSHSPESVKLLSLRVARRDDEAVTSLYTSYTPSEIKQWGGPALMQNLLNYSQTVDISNGPASVWTLLMLVAFPPNPEVRQFLTTLHTNGLFYTEEVYFQRKKVKHQVEKQLRLPYYGTPKNLSLVVDIALSEEGDQEASQRVIQSIRQGEVDRTVVFVVRVTRFIHQKPVLREIVELLRDKRLTGAHYRREVATEPVEPNSQKAVPAVPDDDTLRVCDLAVAALAESTGIDSGIPDLRTGITQDPQYLPARRFTDRELQRAYLAFKSGLKSE